MTTFLLLVIGILSVAGVWLIYKRSDDENSIKKMMAALLAIIIVLSASFMYFDAETRNIALGTGEATKATLAYLLGLNYGGYSPYLKDSWGGTQPDQDFDFDGIQNMWDDDADNDGLLDAFEYPTRFNPFQPDVGIKRLDVQWTDDDELHVVAISVQDLTGIACTATLYLDDIIKGEKAFGHGALQAEWYFKLSKGDSHTVEVRVAGTESDYANQANNYISYTIPAGVMGIIGEWYSDLENEIDGIIRNSPLFNSDNPMAGVDSAFRDILASAPFMLIIIIVAVVIILTLVSIRRQKKGKPPLFSWGRKKPPKFDVGDIVVKQY